MAFSTAVLYSSSLWVRTSASTTLHAVPNAAFTLYLAGTTTPATIYADANFTVLNTTGAVTTDSNGNYSCWLARDNNYQISYLGATYPAFDPDPTGQELQAELGAHAASTSGVHGATAGDPLVSTSAMNTAIANAASGGATPDATSLVKGKLALSGDLAGTAASPAITTGLRSLITNAEQTANKGAVNGYASLDSGGKVPTGQLPSTGTTPDATGSTNGIVRLAGDLAGTAAAPAIESTLRGKITGAVPSSDKGVANGVASLDSGGKVPSGQLPSGGFSGDFANAIASDFREKWISITTTTLAPALTDSGCIYTCNNNSGVLVTLPSTALQGTVYTFQQANATGRVTIQTSGGSNYVVEADSHFKTAKQNAMITAHCVSGSGTVAGWVLEGYTAA